jgi:SNF family Na+-dependent transporter
VKGEIVMSSLMHYVNLPQLIAAVAPIVVAGVKKVVPKVPKVVLPVLSVVVGTVAGYVTSVGPLAGATYGAVGVALREVVDQVKKALDAEDK